MVDSGPLPAWKLWSLEQIDQSIIFRVGCQIEEAGKMGKACPRVEGCQGGAGEEGVGRGRSGHKVAGTLCPGGNLHY